jgi:hypothetical protein
MKPPRLEHNSKLMDELINRVKLTYRFPRVSKQLPTSRIGEGLVRFGYNPSITQDAEGLITMAYRYHEPQVYYSRLALAQIGPSGEVLSNRALPATELSMEDPKLFWLRDELYISWVESTYPAFPFKSVVKYGRVVNGEIKAQILPKLPDNDMTTMQKNYVFFECLGDLYCIYRRYPMQRVYQLEGQDVVRAYDCPGLRWYFGEPRGGSPPKLKGDKMISFFHSSLDNEQMGPRRRYYMGAVLMEKNPPFQPLEMSMEPILCGSEVDDIPPQEWSQCKHHKGQVVFPGGVIAREDHWLVSVGVNDCECLLVKVTPKDLKL